MMDDHSDYLRTPDTVFKPDSRSPKKSFMTGQPLTIERQYNTVADIVLHENVPDDVRVQFETVKNIYLYAWFVYRFYPVAKTQAYACLELALRERFEAEMLAAGEKKRGAGPGLKQLLRYALEHDYLKDENFSAWQQRTVQRAKDRTERELWEEARRNGLDKIQIDETQYEIKDEDRDHEYMNILVEVIPRLRNHYAHGSNSLDNRALDTIQLVAEMINQIYQA